MLDVQTFQRSKWRKSRGWFVLATFAMVLHGLLTIGSIGLLCMLFVPEYEFGMWERILGCAALIVNFVLCKWLQWEHTVWEIYLDAYERQNGLNSEHHRFVDEMKRQGKWPRSY